MPAAIVEPEPPESTAPFAHCTRAPLQDGYAALSPRFDCNAREVLFGGRAAGVTRRAGPPW